MNIRAKEIGVIICVFFIIVAPYYLISYKEIKENRESNQEKPWKGIIVIWDFPRPEESVDGSRYGWLRKCILEYEKENKGVLVEFVPIERDKLEDMLDIAKNANTLPDIVPMEDGYRLFVR